MALPKLQKKLPHLTDNYSRFGLFNPIEFNKFRSPDMGQKGTSKPLRNNDAQNDKQFVPNMFVSLTDFERGVYPVASESGSVRLVRGKPRA